MNAMSNAEKQKAYRERQAAKKVADELFEGATELTIQEFLDGMEYDETLFFAMLDGLGEESAEYTEERDGVWQEAYDEAYQDLYQEALTEAEADGFDIRNDDDSEIQSTAHERATEIADEAVDEWEHAIEDYESTKIVYSLQHLLAAYRAAHGLE